MKVIRVLLLALRSRFSFNFFTSSYNWFWWYVTFMWQFSQVNQSVNTTKVDVKRRSIDTSSFTGLQHRNSQFTEYFSASCCASSTTSTWKDGVSLALTSLIWYQILTTTTKLSVTYRTSIQHWAGMKSTNTFKFCWKSTFNGTRSLTVTSSSRPTSLSHALRASGF